MSALWFKNCLPQEAPSFQVKASRISIINEPIEFYEEMMRKIALCEERITFSSLYIGTGVKERNLLTALQAAVERNPHLRITLLSDYTRGTRVDGANSSSKDLLK